MSVPPRPPIPIPPLACRTSRSGSALLLTILTVSLLMVLVLAFAAQIRVELREIQNRQALAQARANARVALEIAVASLQKHAGNDTRITATSERTGSTAQTRWTGVWASSETATPWSGIPAGAPVWLVSGTGTPQPDMPLASGKRVRIFPDDPGLSDADDVVVPSEDIPGAGGTGRFAWWVGDEGVKARVDLAPAPVTSPAREREIRALTPQGPAFTQLGEAWSAAPAWADAASKGKLASHRSLGLVDPAFPEALLRHELSTHSVGLPVNVRDGGLKADWSVVLDQSMAGTRLVDHYLGASPGTPKTWNGTSVYEYPAATILRPERFFLSASMGAGVPSSRSRPGPNLGILWQYGRLWRMVANQQLSPVPPLPLLNTDLRKTDWRPYDSAVDASTRSEDLQHQNAAVSPVVSHLRFGIRLRAKWKGNDASTSPPTPLYALQLEYKPLIGLWNPYTVGLAPSDYTLQWFFSPFVKIRITNSLTGASSEHVTWPKVQWPGIANVAKQDGEQLLRLRVVGQAFEPGEVRLFSIEKEIAAGEFKVANEFIVLTNSWSEAGVIVAAFDEKVKVYEPKPLVNIPARSVIEVLEVGLQDSYHPETQGAWTFSGDFGHTWINLVSGDGYSLSRINGLWNSGPANQVPPTKSGLLPEMIHTAADLPANTTPESLVGNPSHLGTWAFHVRTTTGIEDPKQRVRGWVDGNARALAMNSHWEAEGDFDQGEGWNYLAAWTGEGDGNRGLAFDESPDANPGRYQGFLGPTSESTAGQTHVPILDVPTAPLVSVGQFQHAPLGRYDFEPTFVLGNSYASLRVPLDQTAADNYNGIAGFDLPDTSYEANRRVWDEIFFSTLAPDYVGGGAAWDSALAGHLAALPNPRMLYVPGDKDRGLDALLDPAGPHFTRGAEALAARIRILGAFNVNSTSKTAWKAVLSSMADAELPVLDPASGTLSWERPEAVRFNKFSHPLQADPYETGEASGTGAYWKGWRKLSPAELDALAGAIVAEVKARGPFRSLSDFVNRDPGSATVAHQRKGPLQAALDRSVNRPGTDLPASIGDLAATPDGARFSNAANGESAAAGHAGYLMQGDLLQSLAPILTVRSDTFVVRAYGETGAGDKAWCEAVLQRGSAYVEAGDEGWENPAEDGLSPVNQTFGRRFDMVSFRWLSPEESGEALK